MLYFQPCENLESLVSQLANEFLTNTDSEMLEIEHIGHLLLSFDLNFYANILRPFLLALLIMTNYFIQFPTQNGNLRGEYSR